MKTVIRARKKTRKGPGLFSSPCWSGWVWLTHLSQGRFYDQIQIWCHYDECWTDISRFSKNGVRTR